jgi:hypothetical protein
MEEQLKLFVEPRVFGLYSPVMGSGKSEVAKVLMRDYGAKLVKFAAPLKDMTRVLLRHMGVHPSLIERHVEGDLKEAPIEDFMAFRDRGKMLPSEQKPLTARYLMQTLGTEWRDLVNRELWTKIAYDNVASELAKGHHVVIDDMRFFHEWQMVQAMNGVTIRIFRPLVLKAMDHASEGALDNTKFDWNILNEGTLDDLKASVDVIMRDYK